MHKPYDAGWTRQITATYEKLKLNKTDKKPTIQEDTTHQHVLIDELEHINTATTTGIQRIKPTTHMIRVYDSDQEAYMTKEDAQWRHLPKK